MNKEEKKLFYQFINKKYIFSFFILLISIFFIVTSFFDKYNNKLIVKIKANSFVHFKVKNHYKDIVKFPGETEWLQEKNLLEDFIKTIKSTEPDLIFNIRIVKDYFSTETVLIFHQDNYIEDFDSKIMNKLNKVDFYFTEDIKIKCEYFIDAHYSSLLNHYILLHEASLMKLGSGELIKDTKYLIDFINNNKKKALENNNNLFTYVEKNKFFLFEKKSNDQKKYLKLIIITISIFIAFFINLLIFYFSNYKKLNKFFN